MNNEAVNITGIKYFAIRDDKTMHCALIACRRKSDGVEGLYDVVNDIFYIADTSGKADFVSSYTTEYPTGKYFFIN